ncbi:MAG: phage tail assembly protein [Bosea sp.]|nr:phage tail assembly protein [Bosea sp. (in: a-proteobacteria)]
MIEPSPAADDKARVSLSRPIEAHGEPLTELVFREPTGGDIARCGNPVIWNPATQSIDDVRFDEAKMNKMIATLAGVPLSTVEKLPAHDWSVCAWTVAGFFLMPATIRSSSAAV